MKRSSLVTGLSAAVVALSAGFLASTAVAQDSTPKAKQHDSKHEAKGVKVGDMAPDFTLTDTTGKSYTLSDWTKKGNIVVLEWFNSECPYCQRHGKDGTMKKIVTDYQGKNVAFLAINSGSDTKDKDTAAVKDWALNYPVLQDASGKVGHLYGAKTTPDMFIIDKTGKIAYMGAIDNNQDGKTAKPTNYVRQALDQVIKGETVTEPMTKPYGCGVHYAS